MEKIITILGAMVAAVNNIRLYPPTSALISNSIDKAYAAVQGALSSNASLLVAESENNLLISGEPLGYRYQQYPQVVTFRGLLSGLRIKSIILKKEMGPTEFRNVMFMLSKSPEDVDLAGGIQHVIAQAGLSTISVTPSLYAPEVRTIQTTHLDKADIDLIKSFLGERRIMEADYMRLGDKAADSKWVAEFFKTAIDLITGQGITLADDLLPETVSKMIQAFSRSTPRENWSRVSACITRALADNDKELLTVVMAKNQTKNIFDTLVKTLSDEHYVEFFSEINRINESRSYAQKTLSDEESSQFSSVLSLLKKNEKTRKLREEIKEKILSEKKRIALDRVHQQKGINRILQGDHEPLGDPLVAEAVNERISQWQRSGKDDQARNLIDKIADGLLDGSLKTRSLASSSLLSIGEMFLSDNRTDDLIRLAQRLNLWIKFETEVTFNFKSACQMLQDLTRRLLGAYRFAEANAVLETFSFIAYGKLKKSDEIRDMAAGILRSIASEKTFKIIFDEFRDNANDQGKNAFYTLIRLGEIAVVPLLDLLRTSEAMSQRVRIINALTEIGKPCLPHIVERLKLGHSWFYVRNLIKLLSDLGSPEHLDILKPLLSHTNDKIPRAALNCAFDIGGDERAKFFIQALSLPDSSLRRLAADLLGKTGSEDGVFPLTQLLKSKGESSEAKHELDLTICDALKRIGSKKAIPVLKSIVTQKGLLGISAYGSELRQVAEATLKYLQSLPSRSEKEEIRPPAPPEETPNRPRKKKTDDFLKADPARLEALVDEYVRQKNISEAVRLLYNMTVRFAREKDFVKAEALREKLFEVDPMALSEIVRTGDIIEQEKANALINDYMNIWGNLYDRLTGEEANDLFYTVKAVDYPPDETIVAQHQMNNRLYFINRGQLKLVHTRDDNEFFLKMLGAGDIAGDDTFFSATVSTVSLITLSQVKVGVLDREALKALSLKHPGLENKLREFCALGDGVNTLVAKLGLERRRQERFHVTGKTLVQLLDTSGKPMGKPFKGNLMDLSVGGLAFMIKANRKETTRLLLGRKLNMAIGIQLGGAPIQVSGVGTIMSARERDDAEVSLHLKFDKTLDEQTMADISARTSRS
ncbi:hypothetical protein JCM14469_34920 [Desulfatiferula olefinivorans]